MGSELGITASTAELIDLSPVSIWWATWACVWTLAVMAGATYLIINRNAPTLRIRGLGLSLSAIGLLHLYWAVCQFGTMIGAILPGDAQYWIMGTFLPLGTFNFMISSSSCHTHLLIRSLPFPRIKRSLPSRGKAPEEICPVWPSSF